MCKAQIPMGQVVMAAGQPSALMAQGIEDPIAKNFSTGKAQQRFFCI